MLSLSLSLSLPCIPLGYHIISSIYHYPPPTLAFFCKQHVYLNKNSKKKMRNLQQNNKKLIIYLKEGHFYGKVESQLVNSLLHEFVMLYLLYYMYFFNIMEHI